MKRYSCEKTYINETQVLAVRDKMLPDTALLALADVFRKLGDPTRTRILHALSIGELCVCDIASLLGTTKSAISHQLRLLRDAALVSLRKEGKIAYYSLSDDHVRNLLVEGQRHVEEH